LSKQLLVVVMGNFKSGKSTLLNALLEQDLLVTDVTPATAAVTQILYGENSRVVAHYGRSKVKEFAIGALARLSAEGDVEGERLRKGLKYVEVYCHSPILKDLILVDTPGLNAHNAAHTEATKSFMGRADAVLWILNYSQAVLQTKSLSWPVCLRVVGRSLL
jgi:GTPase Era involved in 16S rRNA processing